jgi:predicted metalloprotease
MKAHAVISVLLVLVCAAARTHDSSTARGFAAAATTATATATAHANAADARSVIAGVAADLESYWRTTLGVRVDSYHGPRAIVYYRSRIETACGVTFMQNAQYCPNDGTVYLDEEWMDGFVADDDFSAIAILAHEWGHEVQDELGAMDASSERRYVRALELQADCFAGLFTHSLQGDGKLGARAVDDARRFFASAGDPSPKTRSHGTGKERVAWFNAGYSANDLAACESVFQKEHAVPRVPSE